MAKKKNKEKKDSNLNILKNLKKETAHGVWAVVFIVLAIFFLLSSLGIGGIAGVKIWELFSYLLGTVGYFLIPLVLCLLGITFFRSVMERFALTRIIGSLLLFVSSLGLLNLIKENSGGVVGGLISTPLINLFDTYVSFIFLIALFLISLFIIFDTTLRREHFSFLNFRQRLGKDKEEEKDLVIKASDLFDASDEDEKEEEEEKPAKGKSFFGKKEVKNDNKENEQKIVGMTKTEVPKDFEFSTKSFGTSGKKFVPPPLSILETDRGKPGVGDIKANANIIKRTLQNFGIDVEMDEISIGPSITRYALKPAEGVKLSRIIGLQNNLALALAAHPIRIEAPIPGKSLVGIEIPN